MSRAHVFVGLVVSTLVATLAVAVVAWMTSGAWSTSRVRLIDVAVVLPVLAAVKLGFSRAAGLAASFLTYWMIAFVLFAWYIKSTGLQMQATRRDGGEV